MSDDKEYIAIRKETQRKGEAKVKNVKKLLKAGKLVVNEASTDPAVVKRKPRYSSGVVYMGHLPHGFYEEEMRAYFSQFGKVSNVCLRRSKKTGRSKGYAFVEFRCAEVAKIVAQTMNNYLMMKKLLKAEYVPRENLSRTFFDGSDIVWTRTDNPCRKNRLVKKKRHNKTLKDDEYAKRIRTKVGKLNKRLQRLSDAGVTHTVTLSDKPDFISAERPKERLVLKIDESEDEIDFTVPAGAIKMIKKSMKKRDANRVTKSLPGKKTKSSKTRTGIMKNFKSPLSTKKQKLKLSK